MNDNDFVVRVKCLTYNHAPYIEKTMEGFCCQQTTFPFVCTIIDDASEDGEQEVIKNYLETNFDLTDDAIVRKEESSDCVLTFARHKTNQNCFFAVFLLKYNHYRIKKAKASYITMMGKNAKYVALCEGDDFWTDNRKLAKQVGFLDEHEDYSFCHTGFDYYIEKDDELKSGNEDTETNLSILSNQEDIRYAILDNNRYRIQTLTVLIRRSMYKQAGNSLRVFKGKFMMGDTPLWLTLLSYGKAHFMPEATGVYRIHGGSSSRQVDPAAKARFDLSSAEMRITMAEHFSLEEWQIEKFYHEYYFMLAKCYIYHRDYKPFIKMKYCTPWERLRMSACRFPISNFLIRKYYDIKSR